MRRRIKNVVVLKRILWVDFIFGSVAGIIGLLFFNTFTRLLNIPIDHIIIISGITILYSICAFWLTQQKETSILLLRIQINANWFWTIVSFGLLVYHFHHATVLGLIYLISQILVVGGLAYLEGAQLQKVESRG